VTFCFTNRAADEFPEARIIVLTTHTGDIQVMHAMNVRARAYLLKSLLDKELLETIRAVYAGTPRTRCYPPVPFDGHGPF
jgi:DNA-binding NarL/FixJ family response regulator